MFKVSSLNFIWLVFGDMSAKESSVISWSTIKIKTQFWMLFIKFQLRASVCRSEINEKFSKDKEFLFTDFLEPDVYEEGVIVKRSPNELSSMY
jgi:hypothetical protein